MTIHGLRKPNEYGLDFALLTHIAAKLKLNIHANARGLSIPFKDVGKDRAVYLGLDYVTYIDLRYSEITFKSGDDTYKLSLNSNPPLLKEAVKGWEGHWYHHALE